jgi:Ca2+-binding RTX toxin-like protein
MFDLDADNYIPLNPDSEIENQLNNLIGGGSSASSANGLELPEVEELPGVVETRSRNNNEDVLTGNKIQLRARINGTADDDRLIGTNDADTIIGDEGDDVLNGRVGADVLQGGEGNDKYVVNPNISGGTTISDSGGDSDFLIMRRNLKRVRLFRGGLLEGRVGFVREGTDLIIDLNRNGEIDASNDLTVQNFFAADGTAGEGFIEQINDLSGEEVRSLSGVVAVGSRAADTLNGGNNNDSLDGANGNDDLNGNNGQDVLMGSGGNDNLVGRDGNDSLDGGPGNDKLDGNGGRDTLDGGGGADVLQGGTGNDLYQLNANNAGGSKIADTGGGNDTLELAGANLRRAYGFVRGQVGYERNESDLVIDLNQNGRYDVNNDLTIENFYVEGTRRIAEGFIEQVDNLSGRDIQQASPVFYEFSFENSGGDAGVNSVSGVVSLPAAVLENENPNRTFEALSVQVTDGSGFVNDEFVPEMLEVDWTQHTGIAIIRGEEQPGSNEFTVVDGKITYSNFVGNVPESNSEVGEYVNSLALRFGNQGVPFDPANPVPFIIANLSSLDDDSYEGAEGCATPYGNGDCALDLTSGTTSWRRPR